MNGWCRYMASLYISCWTRPQDFRARMKWLDEFILTTIVSNHGQTYFKHMFASNEVFQTHPNIRDWLTSQILPSWTTLVQLITSFWWDLWFLLSSSFCGVSGFFSASIVYLIVELTPCDDHNSSWRLNTSFIKFFSLTFRGRLASTITSFVCHQTILVSGNQATKKSMFNRIPDHQTVHFSAHPVKMPHQKITLSKPVPYKIDII